MNAGDPRRWGTLSHWKRALMALLSTTLAGVMLQPSTTVGAAHNGRSGAKVHQLASTVPGNGDVNPYGVAVVPPSIGRLHAGNVLVSNFNNVKNEQGTGTTIVQISLSGAQTLFASIDPRVVGGSCPGGGIGLTTALVVLRSGWVIVGSLPAPDGTPATAQAGCLLILNSSGAVVKTIAGRSINGPWDMTAVEYDDRATQFVSNVLNGTVAALGAIVHNGMIVRIVLDLEDTHVAPREISRQVIATGFADRSHPAALVLGETGLGLSKNGADIAHSTREVRTLLRASDHDRARHSPADHATSVELVWWSRRARRREPSGGLARPWTRDREEHKDAALEPG